MQITHTIQNKHLPIPTIVIKLTNQKVRARSVERTKIMNSSHLNVKSGQVGFSWLIG